MPTWDEQMAPTPPPPSPRLDRLQVLWRLHAASGRVWECVLYRVATGRELRLQPEGKEDAAAMITLIRSEDDLEPTTESWRAALVAKGVTAIRVPVPR